MKTVFCALAIVFAAATAAANPVTFDINKSITQGGASADFANTTVVLGSGVSLILDPGSSGQYLDLQLVNGKMAMASDSALKIYGAATTISAATVGTSSLNAWGYAINGNAATTGWTSSLSNGYLGFVSGAGQYGYINFDWTYSATTKVGTLSLKSGAFESVAGTAIVTRAATDVPEPASLALVFAGLLGAAVARKRRA
jgi:hypothetical protein